MSTATAVTAPATGSVRTWRMLLGFVVIFAVFEGAGFALAGAPTTVRLFTVSAVVIVTALLVQRMVTGARGRPLLRSLGMGRGALPAVVVAGVICLGLVACYPLLSALTGVQWATGVSGWALLGIYAQNGVAEEIMIRGYLYRHLRAGRGFGRAVLLVVAVHAAAHALLIPVVGVGVGISAMLVAALIAVPYAAFFDRGAATIWPVALLHGTSDTIMLLFPSGGWAAGGPGALPALLTWFALIALLPYLIFLVPRRWFPDL
jgi:hypothetical protein